MRNNILHYRLLKLLQTFGASTVVLALSMSSTVAVASSWNPGLLVNTEAFQVIDDQDAASDVYIQFGDTLAKELTYERNAQRFSFDDYLHVEGNISATGAVILEQNANEQALTIDSAATAAAAIQIDIAGDSDSPHLEFGQNGTFDTNLFRSAANTLETDDAFTVGGALTVDGTTIINNDGDTSNFRVATDNDANTLFVHGTLDRVGIGESTPGAKLDIASGQDTEFIQLSDTTNGDSVGLFTGAGSPEGIVAAQVGSIYMDSFRGSTYTKFTDDGLTTGWEELAVSTGAHIARMTRDASLTINAAGTKIDFDTITFDDGGIANTTTDLFTIANTGSYLINAAWTPQDLDSSDFIEVCIYRNGIVHACNRSLSPVNNALVSVQITDVLQLNAGDTIEMYADTDRSGGADTSTAGQFVPYMSVSEISNVGGGGGGGGGGGISIGEGDDRYVNTTGDSMSGSLLMDMESNATAIQIDSAATTEPAIKINIAGSSSSPHMLFGENGIFDTNLFRQAADILRTDDSFFIGGSLTVSTLKNCARVVTDSNGTFQCTTSTGAHISITTEEDSLASASQFDIFEDTNYTGTLDYTANINQNVTFTSSNGRFIITETGAYHITLNLLVEKSADSLTDVSIQENGVTIYSHNIDATSAEVPTITSFTLMRDLSTNDYIKFLVNSADASTVTIHDGTTATLTTVAGAGSGAGGTGGAGTLDGAYDGESGIHTITVDDGDVSFDLTGANDFIINPQGTGGVGIGETSPETELDVQGTMSGSNIVVSNFVNSDLIPGQDLVYNLGTGSMRWKKIYVEEIDLSGNDETGQAVDLRQGGITVDLLNDEAGAGVTIESGSVVQIDSGGGDAVILTTSKNNSPIGIAINDSQFGENVEVLIIGKATVKCAGVIAIGDLIQSSNTVGHAEAGGSSTKILGNALSTCVGGRLRAIVHLE